MSKLKDLTGQRFGRLVVIERDLEYEKKIKTRGAYWKCQCDCGKIKTIYGINLRKGLTRSCGCLSAEKTSERFKKYNKYNLAGKYGIGFCSNTNKKFYFDLEDYELIKDHCWQDDSRYVEAIYNGKKIYLHRLIMGISNHNDQIDHINHNTFDNRKVNLRVVTASQNRMNQGLAKNNTSGTTGVHYYDRDNVWIATLMRDHNLIIIGRYINKEDAIRARKNAEEKYFQEYSYDNSLKESKKYAIP